MRDNTFCALLGPIGEDKGASRHPQNTSTLNITYGSDFAVDTFKMTKMLKIGFRV